MTNLSTGFDLKSGDLTLHGSLWSFLHLLFLCKHSPMFPHLTHYRQGSWDSVVSDLFSEFYILLHSSDFVFFPLCGLEKKDGVTSIVLCLGSWYSFLESSKFIFKKYHLMYFILCILCISFIKLQYLHCYFKAFPSQVWVIQVISYITWWCLIEIQGCENNTEKWYVHTFY